MTTLFDLVDQAELDGLIADGRIKRQVHPQLPISVLNYTARAQWANIWTRPERVCRGLIIEDGTNRVIARGPAKFMNYGQPGAPETTLDTLVRVTTKHDGSLGIGWTYEHAHEIHYGIATRGSFMSDQAKHATAKIDDDMMDSIYEAELDDESRIFEIVHPGNRIVLNYGDLDALLPLGDVDNETGLINYRPGILLHSTHADFGREFITLREALELEIPHDEEGYVLDIVEKVRKMSGSYHETVGHVKLKGEEYKILHGLLTNTSARRIWVQLAARACHHWIKRDQDWGSRLNNDPADFARVDVTKDIVDTFLTNVPDEFYDWVTRQIDSMNDKVSDLVIQSILLAGQLVMVDDKRTRYEAVKDHPMCMEILRYVESRDESNLIIKAWALAKPSGDDTPFKTQTEED